jgi:hypothetical protein
MFWFDSGGTNTMYYHNGTTRVQIGSGGGSGVTAITAGTGLTGGTITTSGTIRLDTTFAATQSDLNTVADNAYNDLADTAAAIRGAGYATTSALADSVSGRQKNSDTAVWDATRSWTNTAISGKQNYSDTSTFDATRAWVNNRGFGTGSVTSAAIANAFGISFTGSPITTTGTFTPTVDTSKIASVASVNVKQNYSDTSTWDATRSWVIGQIPSVTGYVPYTGATQSVNLGSYSLTTNRTTVDTVKAKSSMGLHLHGTGGTGIMIGAGGGGNITFDDYKTTTTGDSVLSTNSAGAIMQYNLKGKLANYALTSAVADSVSGRQKYSDTTTWDATRSWVVSQGYGTGTIKALTGDVTANGTGTVTATLATVNASPATYTNATVTVDSKGRVTSASSGTAPVTSVSGTSGRTSSTGGTTPVIDLTTVNATPATYGGASAIPVITVDAYGRATTVTTVSPATNGTVTSVGSGFGLTGGAITTTGTLRVDSTNVPTQYRVDTTAQNALTRINTKGSGTVTSIQLVAGTGVTITPTTAVTTSGVYTVSATGSTGVNSITSTNNSVLVSGTTTVNVAVDTTKATQWTVDQTIDSVVFGTGGGLSTNIKIGRAAFAAPTTATGVIAIGENAGRLVTTGQNDIYIGRNAAGNSGTAVSGHVGIGTGNLNYSTGDNNTAIGFNVMARSVAWNGIANVGVGINAGNVMTSATGNTFVGSGTAAALTSGGSNTFLGVSSGSAMTTGSNNIILGGNTGNGAVDIRTLSNRMILSDGAGNIRAYHNATNWLIGTVTDASTGLVQISGNLGLNTAGNKINIATGSNAAIGTATLVGGTVTVTTTAITASSVVVLTGVSTGAPPCATCGALSLGTVTAGTSFVINSSLSTDTRVVQYIIFN